MIDRCHCSWIVSANEFIMNLACSTNSKHTSNNRVFALGPIELKRNLYARRQPVKGTGSVDLRASVPAHTANPDNIYILTFFRIFISIVESSLYAETMAGPSGHRREKKWILICTRNFRSTPAKVDEIAQMRFPQLLVFSSVHPISKIFVSTIWSQFMIPTVWRTSGIAGTRRRPS